MASPKQLSWNEIRSRAHEFVAEWKDETQERAEKDTFWNQFFGVFGISRRRVMGFERNVTKLKGTPGFIDGFWPGMILVEHKSGGVSLQKGLVQAQEYLDVLPTHEHPRFIVISNFAEFLVIDQDAGETSSFSIEDLPNRVEMFGPLIGVRASGHLDEAAVNVKAAALLGDLHDQLDASGYGGHQLHLLLVRVLFLLFADDTQVWESSILIDYLENFTAEDGRDVGMSLQSLFEVLNTPEDSRQTSMDEALAAFPYINGDLFSEPIPTPSFDREMRDCLLRCAHFDWSAISPAIFGSMFQSVMNTDERRDLGAHYTTEKNILKVIDPLFLSALRSEFLEVTTLSKKRQRERLMEFKAKLGRLRFFDPACGCGNFLLIAYRELRLLELDALKRLRDLMPQGAGNQYTLDALAESEVTVDQFYGIEIEEFPALIAETAMYLMDHLMNRKLSEEFGLYYARFPITAAATIVRGNALRLDWNAVIQSSACDFILGNPPFRGRQYRSVEQQEDMKLVFGAEKGIGVLDYVTCWYRKAVDYMKGSQIRTAFVSTNSITQGENVGVLWPPLLEQGLVIGFGHRTFAWTSEAKGKAAVHVVIVGFSLEDTWQRKLIFEYASASSEPVAMPATVISPYLVAGEAVIVKPSRKLLSPQAPEAAYGSMSNDGGALLVEADEISAFEADPVARTYLRPIVGADEMLRAKDRRCLWLADATPSEILNSPLVRERVQRVREYRSASKRAATRAAADTPSLFTEPRPQTERFLLIPYVSSELRRCVPMAFYEPTTIVRAPAWCIPGADENLFGLLQSAMFTAWIRVVAGRLESRLQLSPGTIYNTFPFPAKADQSVGDAALEVLSARSDFSDSTLAELYSPIAMPRALSKAHDALDKAVDRAFSPKRKLTSDAERLTIMLDRYQRLTNH